MLKKIISILIFSSAILQSADFLKMPPIPQSTQENSLLFSSWRIYSQQGEEGILDEILKRLNIKDGFFVEFGGWDGVHLSNTRFLADRGWAGAFIEADKELSDKAQKNCQHLPKVQCINEFVNWKKDASQGKTLEQIAEENFSEHKELEVLSIDIDGADYLILENLKLRPKIIIIEGGINWFPAVKKRIPNAAASNIIGQPLPVMFDIAKKKGYKPVCFTINTFFVREDLFEPFKEIKNDAMTLWFDSWYYYLKKDPNISAYIRHYRANNPWVKQFDKYPPL